MSGMELTAQSATFSAEIDYVYISPAENVIASAKPSLIGGFLGLGAGLLSFLLTRTYAGAGAHVRECLLSTGNGTPFVLKCLGGGG